MTSAVFPIVKHTDTAEASPGTPTPSQTILTFVANHTAANLTLTPHSTTATFNSSSDSELAKFGITTDNYTGYTLSIAASDDDGLLTNTDASVTSNNTLSSIDTILDSTTFDVDTYNGKWGYVPSKYNSAANISFRPAPTTTASTLDSTSTANSTANNYTIGLGARVTYDQPAGTYTNAFTLAITGNPVAYAITYADDTGDTGVANLPSFGGSSSNHTQVGSVTTTSIGLSSTIPTRTNYTFYKWCLGSTSNSGTTCNGLTFDAGADFGIDQTTENEVTLNALWTPNITIKIAAGIASVSLNGQSCTSTTGCIVTGLVYGQAYDLTATPTTGYSLSSWNAGTSGSITNNKYTVGSGPSTITPVSSPNQYTITLNANGGSGGSASTTATYDSTTLAPITNPSRGSTTGTRTVSGFTMGTGASSASVTWPTWSTSGCTSASNCKSTNTTTYAFNGWYKEAAATTKIASNATTPVLQASTSYTDASGKWTSTSAQTLYAGWTASAGAYSSITLPAISKTGHTCSWNTNSTGTGTNYTSGGSFTPSGNTTLYGYCYANSYTQTVQVRYENANGTWGNYSTYSACTKNVTYGSTHSCSIAADGAYQAASLASYTVTGTATKYIDVYRKTTTVSITNSNTSSGATSLTLRYGGSNTVTVTPNSGYYLSSVSCPSGYTCTGYSTGTSYTDSQTVTITNNSTTNNGTLKFVGTLSCQTSISGTMQAFSTSGLCDSVTSGTLSDSRDNQNYTVAKINGNWWMTRNLAIGCNGSGSSYGSSVSSKTLTSEDSNVSRNFSTPTALLSQASSSAQTADLSAGRMQCDSTYGAWYNYYAATAGTISGSSNKNEAQYSICPKGWRLPTNSEMSGIISYASSFSPVTGGYYVDGSLRSTDSGARWWSSTVNNSSLRYFLYYSGSSLATISQGYRYFGYYVRCIKAS